MINYNEIIATTFCKATLCPKDEILPLIEFPPQDNQGDRAIPCFRFAKAEKKSPMDLAKSWAEAINKNPLPKEITRVEAAGGYVNFYFDTALFAKDITDQIFHHAETYGKNHFENPPSVIVEYSSPNIAKPFSIGNLRSTNIGASLARIFEYRGYKVTRINHLGDWGTQFGKLIVAFQRWGNPDDLRTNPIQTLLKLYVKYHAEEANDPTLAEQAREAFAKLEQGNKEVKKHWENFCQMTMIELEGLYKKLGVTFDHYWGESFYISYLPALLQELHDKKLSKESQGALIVDLKDYNLGVALLRKGDESSLYLTRDLAAAIYRKKNLDFSTMLYIVGAEQSLHFQQFFKILSLLGNEWIKDCEHIAFGLISFGDEKMSTRKGNVVFLTDVLEKAKEHALKIVQEKNKDLQDKETVAEKIALGAILFADISAKRIKNVKFSWEEILSFEGETGPSLQYALVRTKSLMKKYDKKIEFLKDFSVFKEKEEHNLVRSLSLFPFFLERAEREREPFVLGQYLILLTKSFNRFYNAHNILNGELNLIEPRMLLVHSTAEILSKGLNILGIPTLEKM